MKATKAFINGKVYTMNKNRDWAQAVAIKDDKILYVGSNETVKEYIDASTEVFDLEGKMLLPGFTDGHCHPFLGAFFKSGYVIDCMWDLQTIKDNLKKYIDENPDKAAYFGQGYNEFLWTETLQPTKEMLDQVCPDKPVCLLGGSGHEGWCNTKALEAAGITADTPDPVAGFSIFVRDESGAPTGHFKETAAEMLIINALDAFDEESLKASLNNVFDQYAACGITSIGDAASFHFLEDMYFPIAYEMAQNGTLKQHISSSTFCIPEIPFEQAIERLEYLHEKYKHPDFFFNTLKILNDGTAECGTAALTQPDPETGVLIPPVFDADQLSNIAIETAKKGFDIHIHAIGDAATLTTLEMARRVREAGYTEMRITNAHTQMVKEENRHLFKEYDVIANSTSVWFFGSDTITLPEYLQNIQFPLKSILDKGAVLNLGSDFPADYLGIQPLRGIEMGLTRRLFGQPDAPFLPPMSEAFTIDDCLDGYTRGALYTHRLEDYTGSLEAGKCADMVVLGENLFEAETYSIHQIPVVMTFMNGKLTYKNPEF